MIKPDARNRTTYYWAIRVGTLIELFPEPHMALAVLLGCRDLGMEPPGEILALARAYAQDPTLKPILKKRLELAAVEDRMGRRAERENQCR